MIACCGVGVLVNGVDGGDTDGLMSRVIRDFTFEGVVEAHLRRVECAKSS